MDYQAELVNDFILKISILYIKRDMIYIYMCVCVYIYIYIYNVIAIAICLSNDLCIWSHFGNSSDIFNELKAVC